MEPRKETIYHESPVFSSFRRDGITVFSRMPLDVTRLISQYYDFDTSSEIGVALQHAADAREEHVAALLSMLETKPHLLLQRGRVITPGGHDVRGVTIYEYCLGAGDPELAKEVQAHFERIPDGEAERIRQYEPYRPHIDNIMRQEPYDLRPLIELIKQASPADVTALLNKDMTYASALRDAIIEFRQAHAPGIITEPCMHYNYRSLQYALELLDDEWVNLSRAGGNNYDKIRLVWRQLIGFEMRRLSGIDRCRLAQGLHNDQWERTYKYRDDARDDAGELPVTVTDDSFDGLGWDFALDIYYGECGAEGCAWVDVNGTGPAIFLETLFRAKTTDLQNLCHGPSRRPGVCS